jgi:hypothetical protein
LNKHFDVEGRALFFYKPVGSGKTFGLTSEAARERLFKQLKWKNAAFIYHCYNHYCCPVGYEREPVDKRRVYSDESGSDKDEFVDWLLIADTSRKYPCFHCVKWSDVNTDLNTRYPEYLNIRHLERGVESRGDKKDGDSEEQRSEELQKVEGNKDGKKEPSEFRKSFKTERNLHCIMKFESFKGDAHFNGKKDFPDYVIYESVNK